jgi:hypothetical protein
MGRSCFQNVLADGADGIDERRVKKIDGPGMPWITLENTAF